LHFLFLVVTLYLNKQTGVKRFSGFWQNGQNMTHGEKFKIKYVQFVGSRGHYSYRALTNVQAATEKISQRTNSEKKPAESLNLSV